MYIANNTQTYGQSSRPGYNVTYIAKHTKTYRQSSRPGYNVTYIAKKIQRLMDRVQGQDIMLHI